ncbi:MAG: HD domain-containing protein [SAR324 cluster bacterium]|nr:HD domain-containing protein [SAR324 cluster bacterium]
MQVRLEELNENMEIQSYIGLEKRFGHLSEQNRQWLAHNFSGARAIVKRGEKRADIAIVQLKVGDIVSRVHKFPAGLKHFTQVNDKLKISLKARKFLFFEVSKLAKSPEHQAKTEQATSLVATVKKSYKVKAQASKAIEGIMDSAAHGVPEIKELEGYVGQIIEEDLIDSMAALAPLRESSHTYAHCVDVGAIFLASYYEIKKRNGEKPVFANEEEALLCAMLHDVGKGVIPKEILESDVKFEKDSPEMDMIRNHPVKGAELIEQMDLPKVAVDMARHHHVKSVSKGFASYPADTEYKDVSYEARLLAIVDVYQSLVGRRPYKKSWTAPSAIRYIDSLAGIDFDDDIWEDFLKVIGKYPKGSLVKLNDQSLGFVVSVPQDNLENPNIVLVQDSKHVRLKEHELIDLAETEELNIIEDLDPEDVFKGKAAEWFANLTIS